MSSAHPSAYSGSTCSTLPSIGYLYVTPEVIVMAKTIPKGCSEDLANDTKFGFNANALRYVVRLGLTSASLGTRVKLHPLSARVFCVAQKRWY